MAILMPIDYAYSVALFAIIHQIAKPKKQAMYMLIFGGSLTVILWPFMGLRQYIFPILCAMQYLYELTHMNLHLRRKFHHTGSIATVILVAYFHECYMGWEIAAVTASFILQVPTHYILHTRRKFEWWHSIYTACGFALLNGVGVVVMNQIHDIRFTYLGYLAICCFLWDQSHVVNVLYKNTPAWKKIRNILQHAV